MARAFNPVAFTPGPVSVICTLVYLALFASLLVVHLNVPKAPASASLEHVNLTEAWHDLRILSNGFHPFNSRRNDQVRSWLLERVEEILNDNNASYTFSANGNKDTNTKAVVFDDIHSNLTSSTNPFGAPGLTTYFESTNIAVYIRGLNDPQGSFWNGKDVHGPGGILVNAHYDSVPAGFGATDDGVGVTSILQLLRYFTSPGKEPSKGLVLLLNNGEEDFLNGARAFGQHPISKFPRAFVNLEGAGAGGRAALFRSTDTEVTKYYRGTESPLGTVILADTFKLGFIRSQTDYVVFNDNLGMRGLDIAFFEPRARYHTDQDDARHTSIDSVWHMLSAALHTTKGLAADTNASFDPNEGSNGIWFDILGDAFVVFELHSLFALSVTFLVVAPLAIGITAAFVSKAGKFYMFSLSEHAYSSGEGKVSLGGLRGLLRFPFILFVPTAILVGLAFLILKLNPFIAYSSPYMVWTTMMSSFVFVAWFLSRAADFSRPSALHRAYSWLWMFLIFWALLVAITVFEDQLDIASGYFLVWHFLVIAIAALISVVEQFRLEKKRDYAAHHQDTGNSGHDATRDGGHSGNEQSSRPPTAPAAAYEEDDDAEPTESTSLLRTPKQATFANYAGSSRADAESTSSGDKPATSHAYEHEQDWSRKLPSWLWVVQFLIVAPFSVILFGQAGLVLVTGSNQTMADGSSPLTVYLIIVLFSVLIFTPILPFLHRVTYHVPTILFLIAVGTLIYNLVAFPFSSNNRLKVYFQERIDFDNGTNQVSISGIAGGGYLDQVINSLPSTAGKPVDKHDSPRADLVEYTWEGIPPRLGYKPWLKLNTTRLNTTHRSSARFRIRGLNTRGCKLLFNNTVSDFDVHGSATDTRFPKMPDAGSKEIRLWTRKWGDELVLDAKWEGTEGRQGRAVCLWNDDGHGRIEALEEVRRFAPSWVAVANLGNGLVEGSRAFEV